MSAAESSVFVAHMREAVQQSRDAGRVGDVKGMKKTEGAKGAGRKRGATSPASPMQVRRIDTPLIETP